MASAVRRLTKALAFAAEAHRNHRRKGANQEPYINHLIEVVDLIASVEDGDMDVLIAALLHDVLEDTRVGYAERGGFRRAHCAQRPGDSDDMTLPKPERRRARPASISKKSREARLPRLCGLAIQPNVFGCSKLLALAACGQSASRRRGSPSDRKHYSN
jgi:HD domain